MVDDRFKSEAATVPDGPQTQEVTILVPAKIVVMRNDKSFGTGKSTICAPICKMFDMSGSTFWCSLFQTHLSMDNGRVFRCNGCMERESE